MNECQNNSMTDNRPLSDEGRQLVRWMLEHGSPEARDFPPQLDLAEATPWRCPCGCASFKFAIDGREAPPGVHVIADFVFGGEDELCGIFAPESLRPFRPSTAGA
jgi:hypothetical protein